MTARSFATSDPSDACRRHRHLAHPLAGFCKYRVSQSRADQCGSRLTDATEFLGSGDRLDINFRHLVHPHYRIIAEVSFLDVGFLQRNLIGKRGC